MLEWHLWLLGDVLVNEGKRLWKGKRWSKDPHSPSGPMMGLTYFRGLGLPSLIYFHMPIRRASQVVQW